MACQDCVNSCYCAVAGADASVAVTGNGSSVTPYSVRAKLSTVGGNALSLQPDGLYASQNAGLPAFSNATRPSSPAVGYTIYNTDSRTNEIFYGGSTGWSKPWGMPWGVIGVAAMQNTTLNGTSETNILNASIAFTAKANRWIKISGGGLLANGIVSFCYLRARRNGTLVGISTDVTSPAEPNNDAEAWTNLTLVTADSPPAGSTTYTMTIQVQASSGGLVLDCGSTRWQMIVEDIGPNGNPA